MNALVLESLHSPWNYKYVETPEPGSDEVVVGLKAASVNRRDWWITEGKYPKIRLPVILGSDGAGVHGKKRVLIYPILHWGDETRFQSKSTEILGMPRNGTFAEKIKVPKENLFDIPDHLSYEEAAALPLAGVTAYRCIFTVGQLKPNQKVLISGIGGGVACLGALFAIAVGAEVWVTSSRNEKITRAIELGCKGGVLYTEPNWDTDLKNRADLFDLVLDSTGGPQFHKFLKVCNQGARIVVYGGTHGVITSLSPYSLFWKQISILGSSMGTPAEFQKMLSLVARHRIRPVIDTVIPLSEGDDARARLREHNQMGKIILSLGEI